MTKQKRMERFLLQLWEMYHKQLKERSTPETYKQAIALEKLIYTRRNNV